MQGLNIHLIAYSGISVFNAEWYGVAYMWWARMDYNFQGLSIEQARFSLESTHAAIAVSLQEASKRRQNQLVYMLVLLLLEKKD